ncbi:NAD(P)H-binding protein [Nonomuraea sp. NPDC049421]|uniref:NAD(P)H-binding protein n=1 Tax=Nonomuraea sp. NPDC049421 TaxID=3155275 RepID=UPI0034196DF4
MRIAVFGANGPTGRLLTGQALAAGHLVAAITRQPRSFPLRHERLGVIGADVLDPEAVDAAVAERDITTVDDPTFLRWFRREAFAEN